MTIRFLDRKEEIRAALLRAVRNRAFPQTYEQFGETIGIWRMRGTKQVLDVIAKEELDQGRPDITFILVSATSGYPSQIDGFPARRPSASQRASAKSMMGRIIEYYCRDAASPHA
ncbi:hypothetical protein [Mesorhizobium sp.]|uniref:hypothetical protein n=1 Tax=Mesorhizobium sp. TaxID=1871066 RepID=UPI000FE4CB23|nr:hypothetical protein [Mesorhizobium sp.]RWM10439.1 MAG: hypothetical protein EOR71_06685 [Mesorhizobium sp.]